MCRLFGYERQVMPKDQKKKRKRASMSATSSQAAPVVSFAAHGL